MIKNSSFKNTNLFIISFLFLPGFFIFSRFLLDLYISSLAIICLIFIFKKKINLIQKKTIALFLLFYIYLIINSFFSFDINISFFKSLPYLRLILFAIFFGYLLTKYKISIIIPLIYSFIFFYTLLFAGSIYELILGKNILNINIANSSRVSSFFGDELILGSYISKTIPIIFCLIFLVRDKIPKMVDFYLIIISTVMIFLSAERTAFAQFVIFIILFILISYKTRDKLRLFFLYLTITITLILINPPSLSRLANHTYNQISISGSILAPSHRHFLHYETAIKMFLDKKILGQGLKSFRYLCDKEKFLPINTILEYPGNHFLSPENGIFRITRIKKKRNEEGFFLDIWDIKGLKKTIELPMKNYQFNILDSNSYVRKGDFLYINTNYKNGCNTHPHNYYLQILSEIGILGFIFILIFFLYCITQFSNKILITLSPKKKLSDFEISYSILFLGLIVFLIPLFPSGSFFNNWISIILYLYIGLLFYFWKEKKA